MPLNQTTVDAVRAHLDAHIAPHLSGDVSNYAKDRKRCWLEVEAPLGPTRPWLPGVHSEKLWPWLTKVWATRYAGTPDLGLAIHGPSDISWHRDAAYAKPDAMIINLGPCNFLWERQEEQHGDDRADYSTSKSSAVGRFWPSTASTGTQSRLHTQNAGRLSSGNRSNSRATKPQPILVP